MKYRAPPLSAILLERSMYLLKSQILFDRAKFINSLDLVKYGSSHSKSQLFR